METSDKPLISNTSLTLEQEATPYLYYQAGLAISNYLSPILFIIGFFGNTLSFIVMLLRHNRQLACCVYLAGLAISDTITVSSILHLWIVTTLLDRKGTTMECRIIAFFFHTGAGSSTFTIVAVTLDRFLATCMPLTYRKMRSRRRAFTTEIIIFIFSFIVCIPFGLNACFLSKSVCSGMNGYNSKMTEVYAVCIIVLFSIIPFVTILSMNIAVLRKLSKLQQKRWSYQEEQGRVITQKFSCISERLEQATNQILNTTDYNVEEMPPSINTQPSIPVIQIHKCSPRTARKQSDSAGYLDHPQGDTRTENDPSKIMNYGRPKHSNGSTLDIPILKKAVIKPSKNMARSGCGPDPDEDQIGNQHLSNKGNVKIDAMVRTYEKMDANDACHVSSGTQSCTMGDIVESPSISITGGDMPPHRGVGKDEALENRRRPMRSITVTYSRQPPKESQGDGGHIPEPVVSHRENIEETEGTFPELKEERGQGAVSISKTWRKRLGGLNAIYRFRSRGANSRSSQLDKQLSRVLLLVSCTFLVLTLPQYIRYTVYTFKDMKSTPGTFATYFLFYHISQKLYLANSAINFILYCIGTTRFRKDAKRLVFFWLKDKG